MNPKFQDFQWVLPNLASKIFDNKQSIREFQQEENRIYRSNNLI